MLHPRLHRLLLPVVLGAGLMACGDGEPGPDPVTGEPDAAAPLDARGKLQAEYEPTREHTIRGLYGWNPVPIALDGDQAYLMTSSKVLRVDRSTGVTITVVEVNDVLEEMAFDAAHIYLATDRELYRVLRTGGEPQLLTDNHGGVRKIAVRDDQVYLLSDGALQVVPVTGGTPTTLATLSSPGAVRFTVNSLLVRDDGIYLASTPQDRDGDGLVLRVPYGGGAPVEVYRGKGRPYYLAGDDRGVYWTAADGYPDIGPPPPTRLYFLADGASAPVELSTVSTAGAFVVNPVGFYWVDYEAKVIKAVPRDGDSGELILYETEGKPIVIAADARGLAWTMSDDGGNGYNVHFLPRKVR